MPGPEFDKYYRVCLDTSMVDLTEVFLPYLITRNGQTTYELMAQRGFLALKEGNAERE